MYGENYDPYNDMGEVEIGADSSEANQHDITNDQASDDFTIQPFGPTEERVVDEAPGGKAIGVTKDLMTLAQAASSGEANTILSAVEQFSKSQLVRFLDISVIGPLLLYWAYKGKLSAAERTVMGLIGAGTVVYNARNFLKNRGIMSSSDLVAVKEELSKRI